jgi:hypothetical protein
MAERLAYRKISDKEREILIRFYDERGMVSKGARYSTLIEEAARETNLSTEQVKVSCSSVVIVMAY